MLTLGDCLDVMAGMDAESVDAIVTDPPYEIGFMLIDGAWWKQCSICDQFKPITVGHWYISPEGWPLYGRCRPCHISKVVESKRVRKMRAATP